LGRWEAGPALLLRHDVDLDLGAAVALAELEQRLGIQASYCILMTAWSYNPAAPINRARLDRLLELGMELGLHFDPQAHSNPESAVQEEAARLQSWTGQPVRVLSLHNPSLSGRFPLYEGFLNAYDPCIFGDDRYLSDSCQDFRSKDPLSFIRRAQHGPLQLLLHPEHYAKEEVRYPQVILDVARRWIEGLDWELREHRAWRLRRPMDLLEALSEP